MSTRETVLAAAQRHLNLDPTASMAEIAAAAGVGRATLHRHFSSREDLLREIGSRSLDRWEESQREAGLAEAAGSDDRDRIRACLDDMLRRFVADTEDFGVALTDTVIIGDPRLRERADALFAQEVVLYAAAQATGVLRSDVPARWLGHTVYGLLVAVRDALAGGDVPRRGVEELVLSTFFAGGQAR